MSRFETGGTFALVCHIDFSLEIFSSFILLYSYCHFLSSGSSHLLGLKPILSTTLQTTIRSMFSLLNDLLLACSVDKPEVFCAGFKALYNRISILPAPPTFLVFLNRKLSTPTTMWGPLCTPLLAQVTS